MLYLKNLLTFGINQWGYIRELRQIDKSNAREWVKTWNQVKDGIPRIKSNIEKNLEILLELIR
jgi:hypothetical protein